MLQLTKEEETSMILHGDWNNSHAQLLKTAWTKSMAIDHKLPPEIRYMEGMSGKKYRYLINNLTSTVPNARYLEIGSWKGSTAASAVYGNRCYALCIDNWSEFFMGAPGQEVANEFRKNLTAASGGTALWNHIDRDFRKVDYHCLGKFNLYMFDGPHSEQDQYDGIVLAQPALEDTYFLIVDDYNGGHVQKGTQKALTDLGSNIVASITILTTQDQTHPQISHQNSDWHNGYFIAVVKKS